MEKMMGLLKINVKRGINLAIRDVIDSDPYVIVRMGKQKVKTHVVKHNLNPVWNDELTLSITDPTLPIKIVVYDRDLFSLDDYMGDAEFDIGPFLDAVKMKLDNLPDGTIIGKVIPGRHNHLVEESRIVWSNGKLVQNMCLRLQNVECGEIELQLKWVDIPGSRGL